MEFEEFKKSFKEDLKKCLEEQGIHAELSENHVEKLNQSYDALSVTPEGTSIGVNVNLNMIYKSYEDGLDYNDVVNRAAASLETGIRNTPAIDVTEITNYESMKHKLAMEVVSADRNIDMLEKVPHETLEDMAVVYRLILDQNSDGRSSILVTNNLMEQFGITNEQLHEDAMINAPEIRPSEIRGMSEVMNAMVGPGIMPEIAPEDEQMFVAGVSDNIHGAGVIAYPNFFEEAAEKLGGDYYVLPSSIHEVLLVRDNGDMTSETLEAMVREVNATQVSPEEQLTDHVYHYDSKEHIFEMADRFEKRQAERQTEEHETDRESVLDDLKLKKETVAKGAFEKPKKDAVKKSRGEAL